MKDIMQYNGYVGSAHYSDTDGVFHGKLEGIRDTITYEATDVAGLKQAFHEAVDDYFGTCAENGKTPEKPFRGTFNVRVGSHLHQRAALFAAGQSESLNALVIEALERYLDAEDVEYTQTPQYANSPQ